MIRSSAVSALGIAVALFFFTTGCATYADITAQSTQRLSETPTAVDTLYVTFDLPGSMTSDAQDFSESLRQVFATGDVYTSFNTRGNLSLSDVPGLDEAREFDFPHLLVVRQTLQVPDAVNTSDTEGAYIARLYDVSTETALWEFAVGVDGDAPRENEFSRALFDAMQDDGLIAP